MIERPEFFKLISRKLYPILREEGFHGSGATLRRIADPLIHIFNVEGSKWGRGCFLNLGVHLSFLPTEGGSFEAPEAFKEYQCVFRGRVHPPEGMTEWRYGNSQEEAEANVGSMLAQWEARGREFFRRYQTYPESFHALLDNAAPEAPRGRLHFARIAARLNRREDAIKFAREGLGAAPERATLLRADLQRILKDLDAA